MSTLCNNEWDDFNGDEEHVCRLEPGHEGECVCRCGHDRTGRYVR